MTKQRNQANVALPIHTVKDVTFSEGTNRTMEDAVTMKLYNGGSRPSLNGTRANGTRLSRH
jgi:hypothetical protein